MENAGAQLTNYEKFVKFSEISNLNDPHRTQKKCIFIHKNFSLQFSLCCSKLFSFHSRVRQVFEFSIVFFSSLSCRWLEVTKN